MRCPLCDEVIATGSLCEVTDTDCYEHDGDGSEATPFILNPIIDPNVNNLHTCTVDGQFAGLPAAISNPPWCRAYNTNNQSIPNNTLTAVTLNSEGDDDTDTMHSNTVNPTRLTFTTAGTYVVNFAGAWNKHIAGDRLAYIRKNGDNAQRLAFDSRPAGGADLILGHNLVVQDAFIATDYVEAMVQQTSGVALLLLAESYSPVLSAVKV